MVKHLLEYTQATESNLQYSLLLVLGLLLTEIVRSWSLALTWALNYRTGVRLRGAILTMAFKKILKLKNIKEKSLGEVSEGCLLHSRGQLPSLRFVPLGPCLLRWMNHVLAGLPHYSLYLTAHQHLLQWWAEDVWGSSRWQPAGWRTRCCHLRHDL